MWAFDTNLGETIMFTLERLEQWEAQSEYQSKEITRLAYKLERSEDKLTELQNNVLTLVNSLAIRLAETDAKLKVQTWYSRFMVSTLIPANLALLYKVFFG